MNDKIKWTIGAGLAIALLTYLGTGQSEQISRQVFKSSQGNQSNLPKKRSTSPFSTNDLSEMALKIIPEPMGVTPVRLEMTDSEEELRDLFISHHLSLDAARDYLLTATPSWEFTKALERYRVLRYLVTAVATPTNPDMDYAVKSVSEVILTDNLDGYEDKMQKTLAMSDRGTLYQALVKFHPEVAHDLYEKTRGTRMNEILDFAQSKLFTGRERKTTGS